jgi:hypothetical protein
MGCLFILAVLACVAWFAVNHLGISLDPRGVGTRVEGRRVVRQAGQLEASFSMVGSLDDAYMLFGGNADRHANSPTHAIVAGLPIRDARLISASYPDFHLCKSRGVAQVQQLYGTIFFGVGIVFVAGALLAAARARRSESWPVTTGTVTGSEIRVSRAHKGARIFESQIEYSYAVHGREYRSDVLCSGGMLHTSSRRRAEERCAKYPVGVPVRVFYQPSDPSRSCLEATAEGGGLMLAIDCGILILAVCVQRGIVQFG